MKKVAWVCRKNFETFSLDLVKGLGKWFDVRLFLVNNPSEVDRAIDWADIVWFEWANETFLYGASKVGKKPCIVRLHHYEALRNGDFHPGKLPWDVPKSIVLVADHLKTILQDRVPEFPIHKTNVIFNGLDFEKYQFTERDTGNQIGIVGQIGYRKEPVMWFQIIAKLPFHEFHVAGKWDVSDARYLYYIRHIMKEMDVEKRVELHGQVDDIPGFWSNKQYLLSTSPHESFGYGIAEAMAMGVKPIIHNFYGAEDIYPKEFLWNTIDEAVEMIMSDEYDSMKYRKAVEKYSLGKQIKATKKVIQRAL